MYSLRFRIAHWVLAHRKIAWLIFIALTIPMTRFADWVQERSRRRRRAGGAS
jgi:hypothetical protein